MKPDVQLYIQLFLVLSVFMRTCQCNGPWVTKTNWRYRTTNACWWSLSLSLSSIHPSSAHSCHQMNWWWVWEIWHPHIYLWVCHFTYHRLTSQYRHNEAQNGNIIPVWFRGGTLITHLSICCHQRKDNDRFTGVERQNESKPTCVSTWNVTPWDLSTRTSADAVYLVIKSQEVFISISSFFCCFTN